MVRKAIKITKSMDENGVQILISPLGIESAWRLLLLIARERRSGSEERRRAPICHAVCSDPLAIETGTIALFEPFVFDR